MFAASDDPVMTLDRLNAALGALHVEMLEVVWTVGVSGAWRGDGASDLPHWLAMRYGISWWKGRRIVTASRALRRLPIITEALRDGRLSLDKVLELARFATAEEEHRQLKWAQGVSVRAVRQKADLYEARSKRELLGAERSRSLGWYWTDEGTRLMLAGEFPAAQGAAVVKAIERMASKMPAMPDEEGSHGIGARRADALAAICSSNLASDRDVDRAMLIVHASEETVSALAGRELAAPGKAARREATRKVAAAAFQDGPAIHPDVLSRLLCTSKIQVVGEDANGNVMALGRDSREPSPAMMRQLRYRDGGCRFPGCGSGRFLNAHHIQHWARGGKTDLDNLVMLCSFHHRLAHEYGWSLELNGREVTWRRPGGALYRAGPSPGEIEAREREWMESLERTKRRLFGEPEGSHEGGSGASTEVSGSFQPALAGVG